MIVLQNVSKHYHSRTGRHTVLDGANLVLHTGERMGILGKNGAGKSTLIRIVSGQESPDAGHIIRDMKTSWPLAFTGGFQGSLTGLDNARFLARIYDVDYGHIKDFIEDFAELGKYLREPVKTYSSGMQARLAFALSLAIEFDCYLIDEVLAVGDARFHEKCVHELFDKRKDRSFLIVSHNSDFIRNHCTRAAVLDNGKLTDFGSIEQAIGYYLDAVLHLHA